MTNTSYTAASWSVIDIDELVEVDPAYVVWAAENIPNHGITLGQLGLALRRLNEWGVDPYDDFEYAQDQARELGYVPGAYDDY